MSLRKYEVLPQCREPAERWSIAIVHWQVHRRRAKWNVQKQAAETTGVLEPSVHARWNLSAANPSVASKCILSKGNCLVETVSAGRCVCTLWETTANKVQERNSFASWQKAKHSPCLSGVPVHQEIRCWKCSYLLCQKNKQAFNGEEFIDPLKNINWEVSNRSEEGPSQASFPTVVPRSFCSVWTIAMTARSISSILLPVVLSSMEAAGTPVPQCHRFSCHCYSSA